MSKITSEFTSDSLSETLSETLSEVTLSSVFGPPCTRDAALTDLLCCRCHHAAIHRAEKYSEG